MREAVPAIPDSDSLCGPLLQRALGFELGGVGADKGHREIEYRASLDDEADAAEDAVDLSVGSESIAVDQRQALCLFDQFLVFHWHVVPPGMVASLPLSSSGHNQPRRKVHFGHNSPNFHRAKQSWQDLSGDPR